MPGTPFIGENGFYPKWMPRGKWAFQRTLTSVRGSMQDYAEAAASRVFRSDQIIVWVPSQENIVRRFFPSVIYEERQRALQQLANFKLLCYSQECEMVMRSSQHVQGLVAESGLRPEQWSLRCPMCGGQIGPDLDPILEAPILKRWEEVGRPVLDCPAAGAVFEPSATIVDLRAWIQGMKPSNLEMAYLGQQLWPDVERMLDALMTA